MTDTEIKRDGQVSEVLLGNLGAQVALLGYSGTKRNPTGGAVTSTGNPTLLIKPAAGVVAILCETSAGTQILLVNDSGVTLTSPLAVGDLTATGNVKWKSGTTFTVELDHAATANRVVTVQDATQTLVGRDTTDTLTAKTLTNPTINSGALSGTFSGNVTLSGAIALSSAGLALSVTNNATIGGTLGVTGTLTAFNALTVGGLISANGGQIAFPAAQNASAGANVLDDYEEGTWSPSLGGSETYTNLSGAYIKIGRVVYIWGVLAVNALGSGSVNTISGLPFSGTDFNDSPIAVTKWASLAASPVTLSFRATGATLVADGLTAAGATSGTLNIFGAGATVYFAGAYRTAS